MKTPRIVWNIPYTLPKTSCVTRVHVCCLGEIKLGKKQGLIRHPGAEITSLIPMGICVISVNWQSKNLFGLSNVPPPIVHSLGIYM